MNFSKLERSGDMCVYRGFNGKEYPFDGKISELVVQEGEIFRGKVVTLISMGFNRITVHHEDPNDRSIKGSFHIEDHDPFGQGGLCTGKKCEA